MRYVLVRCVQGVFIMLGVSIITFFMPALYFTPLELGVAHFQGSRHIDKAEIIAWVNQQGLNKPLLIQFGHWLWDALHFNFGVAYVPPLGAATFQNISVKTVLGTDPWRSVWLVVPPTIVSILIAIPIGLTQAVRRNKLYDHTMTTIVFLFYSTPAVLVCTLLAFYFGVELHWAAPLVSSNVSNVTATGFPSYVVHNFSQFVLPYIAIILLSFGGLTRYMRGSALDTLVQDYVRTAKAKGASPNRVLFRHVLRPSVIPLITIIGLSVPIIIAGALIVEVVFNFPGMGALTVQAVESHDFTVVMAITLITAFLTVLGNLLADVFTAVADPRVRLGESR
jgi:peptide/nickel transport system permease protein